MKFSFTYNAVNPLIMFSVFERGLYLSEGKTFFCDNYFSLSLFGFRFTLFSEVNQ